MISSYSNKEIIEGKSSSQDQIDWGELKAPVSEHSTQSTASSSEIEESKDVFSNPDLMIGIDVVLSVIDNYTFGVRTDTNWVSLIRSIRNMGFDIAIRNYGTGYSALSN